MPVKRIQWKRPPLIHFMEATKTACGQPPKYVHKTKFIHMVTCKDCLKALKIVEATP
jgi:hypothetical protein